MEREYVPEPRDGAHVSQRVDGLGVDRIDINDCGPRIEPADRRASGYISDGRGNVRMMILTLPRSEGQLGSRTDYFYRLADYSCLAALLEL